jgi:protein SCO1/2
MNKVIYGLLVTLSITLIVACTEKKMELPIIGDRTDLDGNIVKHRIRDFKFVNQLGDTITNSDYKNKIYVVDVFFTSCPSICPKVMKQMLRIYDQTKDMPDVMLVSHTIDPKRDTPDVLKKYADNFNIDHNRWHFLYGDKDQVFEIANEDYFVAALEAEDAPGGYDHSGKIILVDKDRRVRSFCDGTDPASVTEFIDDIILLRKEYGEQ